MMCLSKVTKVDEWKRLAWKHANTSDKKDLQGVEPEDLYQCAMIGILEAHKRFDEKRGDFPSYAYWYIQKEINDMIYNRTHKDGKLVRQPKMQEELCEDLGLANIDECEQLSYDVDYADLMWADQFIETLPLEGIELDFFNDMVVLGDRRATKHYRELTGVSRQYANQVKQKIRAIASAHAKEMK